MLLEFITDTNHHDKNLNRQDVVLEEVAKASVFMETCNKPELNLNLMMLMILMMMLMMMLIRSMVRGHMMMMMMMIVPGVPPPFCRHRGTAGCYRGSAAKVMMSIPYRNIVSVHCREEGCIGKYIPRGPRDFQRCAKSPPEGNLKGRRGCISQCIPIRGSVCPFSQH